ncbi:folylpolyglutamate synthase/dihydrofolate synthase family protein [Adlercreutzia sp. ZJ138]|uniref:bifunctional folylpolyglutamate synthase/dihydrofolate synthase n=1 Tax=Adlercreutzia sp. ZJ138 TaxID=2709405 RepID=UPI0013ECCB62|nr:folylpolyglutamate synthase/dihydrofolate synthase family protein [Adlercreutzia sp. ZJ138]
MPAEENPNAGFDAVAYINEPRWQASRLGLDRIRGLLDRMGNPQRHLRFVHVAGTNGKGSVCAYLASVLQAAGFRTGLFTSPYIIRFEERIRVNGKSISEANLRAVTLFVRSHAEAMAAETGDHPTEFELMTAVAFEYFARSGCDIAVVEVGLGGRLDSTNVIEQPEVCAIARIGLDHTALLGDTVAAIAGEKAGIVKSGATVVSYPQEPEAADVINHVAASCGCMVRIPDFSQLEVEPVCGARRAFRYKGSTYTTQLLGSYQPENAALVIEIVAALRARGWNVSDEALCVGIASAQWPGRFEVITLGVAPADMSGDAPAALAVAASVVAPAGPLVDSPATAPAGQTLVIDGGHNPQGAFVLADSLRDAFPGRKVTFACGVLADKDYRAMVAAVAPLANAFVCAAPPNPRALPADDLARAVRTELQQAGVSAVVETAPTMASALARARELAAPGGLICAFGSLYSIAELKASLA